MNSVGDKVRKRKVKVPFCTFLSSSCFTSHRTSSPTFLCWVHFYRKTIIPDDLLSLMTSVLVVIRKKTPVTFYLGNKPNLHDRIGSTGLVEDGRLNSKVCATGDSLVESIQEVNNVSYRIISHSTSSGPRPENPYLRFWNGVEMSACMVNVYVCVFT